MKNVRRQLQIQDPKTALSPKIEGKVKCVLCLI